MSKMSLIDSLNGIDTEREMFSCSSLYISPHKSSSRSINKK